MEGRRAWSTRYDEMRRDRRYAARCGERLRAWSTAFAARISETTLMAAQKTASPTSTARREGAPMASANIFETDVPMTAEVTCAVT